MTNFSHDNREPPMLNDSERPVMPSLNSTTSGRSGLKIFIFVALFGLISVSGLTWFALNQGELKIGNERRRQSIIGKLLRGSKRLRLYHSEFPDVCDLSVSHASVQKH